MREMLSVAIVDDEAEERRRLRGYLDEVAQQKGFRLCADEYETGDAFLVQYQPMYDLVFLDIDFPNGQNGIEIARALRRIDTTVVLIFVTNMAQLAVEGYEVDALDFIVKPIDRYAFQLKMTRALSRVALASSERIAVRQEGEMRGLKVPLIRYLTIDGHYVIYHSREGDFSEYITLAAAEKKLNSPLFCRCNRGCLVNLRFVSEIRRDTCVVDGDELAVARTQRAEFLKAYAQFLGGTRQGG
ncbi:MAG: LytTR family DNA-binding domain-containing protein [Clostridiales bacterium]|nr:LytTR family DNA-binding domain-containing protein [Clostridiales bacterium]